MIRVLIENILLFLAPTLIYVVYVYLAYEPGGRNVKLLDGAPLIWLFVAGALLVVVTLVAFGSTSGGRPGQVYEPPVLKDGRIEPGRIH